MMMKDDADPSGDADPSRVDPGNRTESDQPPREAVVDVTTSSNDTPHVIYDPLPTSRATSARQQRAHRRAYHARTAPSWVKKIPWVIFPLYGIMRRNDPNYEEHFAHWVEQQRTNYDE